MAKPRITAAEQARLAKILGRRTMPMIRKGFPPTSYSNPCAVCYRELKEGLKVRYFVHLIDGGGVVLHPADEGAYVPDGGDCGSHEVGSDCAKLFGAFASKSVTK